MLNLNAIALIITTMIWGLSFVGTRWCLQDFSPLWITSFRYLLAGILSLPFLLWKRSFSQDKLHLGRPLLAAVLLLSAMLFQTSGLKYTSVAKNGFITTFYAIFVPIISIIWLKKRFSLGYWPLLGMGITGIALLCNLSIQEVNKGDVYTLFCAILLAFHIIYTGKIVPYYKSSIELNCLQCLYMGLLSLFIAPMLESTPSFAPLLNWQALLRPSSLTGLIFIAVFSSMIAYGLKTYSQRTVPPHIVGLIFLLEAPFAAFFGFLLLGEMMSSTAFFGGLLVITAAGLVPFFGKEAKKRILQAI